MLDEVLVDVAAELVPGVPAHWRGRQGGRHGRIIQDHLLIFNIYY